MKNKKFLSIFLMFVVCFSMLTTNVFAYSDYVQDDVSENLNNFEITSNYSKTFTIPGYTNLKALGIKPSQFDGYGRRYDCNLFYIYSNDLNVLNVQTGQQETISTNKYFYVLTLGQTSNDFYMWRNTDNDTSDNGVNTTKKYNNISLINNVVGIKLISEDGQNWYYLDESLNTEIEKVGIEANNNFYSYNFRYIENPYYMFYVSPNIANNIDFGEAALSVDNYVQYYYNFNQTLYQFGSDQRTPWVDDGGYQFKTPAINQNLIDYPSIYKFDYPNDDSTINLSVPYDAGYLNNTKSSETIIKDPYVWWTSLSNNNSINYEIHEASYLESITFAFYTGSLSNKQYKFSVSEVYEDGSASILKSFDLYNGYNLKSDTFYQVDFNIKDKMKLEEGKLYSFGVCYYSERAKKDIYLYDSIIVRCLNGFNKSSLLGSTENDIYYEGVAGYPDDPDDYITGGLEDLTKPSINPDNSVVDNDVKNFNTGIKWLDSLLNSVYGFYATMFDVVVSVFSLITDSITLLTEGVNDLYSLVSDVFTIFPPEIQIIFKGILSVFVFYVIARLLLKIIG